ncbi:MAG: FliM/FliN family flagellar motor switch protein [Firmicutes bacterium]|nr:FliM/FliN family flagellar motor switch protein [Bacillota bacterium]
MMNQQEIQELMEKMQSEGETGEGAVKSVRFPSLKPDGKRSIKSSLSHLDNIEVNIYAELGQTKLKVRELLNLEEGSVLELNKAAGEAVDVYINEKQFSRAEILVSNDYFAVRLNKIARPSKLEKILMPKSSEEG